jgi:hypothetical protein
VHRLRHGRCMEHLSIKEVVCASSHVRNLALLQSSCVVLQLG